MPKNPVNKGMIARNTEGIGAVNRAMINKRAKELALMSGRIPPVVSDADYEQAERELSGGPELDRKEELIEALPESERWDPVPGSKGVQPPEVPNEDEDDEEGRNESAQLIEDGVHEAEHDQMLEAEKAARRSERGA
ncbi:MAG TPA: hypothetical protein VII43_02755 [Opitutaceae bacterium]